MLNYRVNRSFLVFIGLGLVTYLAYSFATHCKNTNWEPKSVFILNHDGSPKPSLLKLLTDFGIQHNDTLDDIVKQTQANWLRKPGQERWDLGGEQISQSTLDTFKACGVIGEVKPALCEYDYVLVMGALASRMRTRFAYAVELWKQGVRFKQLVLLTGQRPRNVELETEKDILGFGLDHDRLVKKSDFVWNNVLPDTESGIMQLLYDQADLPADFRQQVQVVLVAAPMKSNAQGQLTRPTTSDTVDTWLAQSPKPGNCLVISNNPYIGYQDSVARGLLPKTFKIETVGHADGHNLNLATYLDNMARWLYQEQQNRK